MSVRRSRRDFLEQALGMAAAARAALPAAARTEESVSAAAPNDKIRVAVIGVNGQ